MLGLEIIFESCDSNSDLGLENNFVSMITNSVLGLENNFITQITNLITHKFMNYDFNIIFKNIFMQLK